MYILASHLFSQCLKLIKYLVSLNSAFPRAYSALIGQMAQFILIGLALTVHVGNKMSIIGSEFPDFLCT